MQAEGLHPEAKAQSNGLENVRAESENML